MKVKVVLELNVLDKVEGERVNMSGGEGILVWKCMMRSIFYKSDMIIVDDRVKFRFVKYSKFKLFIWCFNDLLNSFVVILKGVKICKF